MICAAGTPSPSTSRTVERMLPDPWTAGDWTAEPSRTDGAKGASPTILLFWARSGTAASIVTVPTEAKAIAQRRPTSIEFFPALILRPATRHIRDGSKWLPLSSPDLVKPFDACHASPTFRMQVYRPAAWWCCEGAGRLST